MERPAKMIKSSITFFLISTFVTNYVFACPKLVKEGEPSPCTGIVLSEDQERKIRTDLIYYKELSNMYKEKSDLDQELIRLERETSRDLRKELNAKDSNSFWEKSLFFVLGVGLTGLASYAAIKAVDNAR